MPIPNLLADTISEKEYLASVKAVAQALNWKVYHTLRSTGSDKGFLDLVLVRGDTCLFIELKSQKGKVSADQQDWIDALSKVMVVKAGVARPSDWPQLQRLLEGLRS